MIFKHNKGNIKVFLQVERIQNFEPQGKKKVTTCHVTTVKGNNYIMTVGDVENFIK